MIAFTSVLTCLLVASSAVAHFTLDYPATRGPFTDDLEAQYCGGFPNPATVRQPFPLTGNGPIWFNNHHALSTVGLLISPIANPTSFSNFTSLNGTVLPFAKNYFQTTSGPKCFSIDLSTSIAPALNLTNGSLVTIQMQSSGGDGSLWQCADLVLIDSYTSPDNWTCLNDVSILANATATITPSIGAAASASMTHNMATGSASASARASASPVSAGERVMVGGALSGLVASLVAVGMML